MRLDVDEFLRRLLLHVLPPGFVRIRNFGFLANRNRAAVAPMLSTTRQHRANSSFDGGNVYHRDSLALELPCLRWNHARHRTALLCGTPASLATSTRPARSMKVYSHPRPIFVLQRARGFSASPGQNPSDASLSRLYIRIRRTAAPRHPAARPPGPAQLGLFLIPLHPFRQFKVRKLM